MKKKRVLIVCTTDSMIWNFLVPHIEELKNMGYEVECASSITGSYFGELISEFHIKMHQLDFVRTPFSIKNLVSYGRLKQLIRQENYEIIFCHEPVGGMMGRLAGKACRKKVVYLAHGFHFFKGAPLKHWLLYYMAEYLLSFLTDACITINKEDYYRAKKMRAKRKYYIHGIGIQPKIELSKILSEDMKKELGIEENDVVLVSVGELSKRKNHQVILEALHILNDERLKLIICGEGQLYDDLKEKAVRLGIEEQVIFCGFVKNVGDYLKISNIFIYPSLFEGLGIAGLEAMDKGISIIGSNRRGIRDYVLDNKTGLLFEPNDADMLADKIKFLMEHESEEKRLIRNATKYISIFRLENVKKELKEIYLKEF